MINKIILWFVLIVGLGMITLFGYLLFLSYDSQTNRGLSFGYWGEMNRIEKSLQELGVSDVSVAYYNRDMFLEEFAFDVKLQSGERIRLLFEDDDPARIMGDNRLSSELGRRLESRRASPSG